MRFQIGPDVSGKSHAPFPGFRLRRPVEVATAWQLGKGPFYPDRARSQVDVTATERRQLAPTETAENRDEDQRPVSRADRAGFDSSGSQLIDQRWIYEYDAWAEAAALM
jgi:hypothetical protein